MQAIEERHIVARIEECLHECGLRPESIVLTNNRVRLASKCLKKGRTHVRLSRRLLALGDVVVEPLVGFFLDDQAATSTLKRLISELEPVAPRGRRKMRLRPTGQVHDLVEIMRAEAFSEWGTGVELPVTWGRRQRRRRRQRGARLGSYDPRGPLIRINRLLDDERVPRWYVGFVIYHEMLHHEFGIERTDARGRRVLHPPEFRSRERQHPAYAKAMDFEADQLWALLNS